MAETPTGFRLSPQQRRAWQIGATNPAFCVQCALAIPAGVSNALLRQAFEAIANREEILRTRFPFVPGIKTPIQVVDEGMLVRWQEIDGTDAGNVSQVLEGERVDHADYETGPLLRGMLTGPASGHRLLVLSLPALCADAETMAMLAAEIAGRSRAPGIPYARFADWQNECVESEDARVASAGWASVKIPPADAVRLACERRTPASAFAPRFNARTLSDVVARLLRDTCERLSVTPEGVLLASWQTLLRMLTECDEVVVGVVAPGRDHAALAGVYGPIAKAIPLGTPFQSQPRFQDLARQLTADLDACREWRAYYQATAAQTFPFTFSWEAWPERWSTGNGDLALVARYVCLERFGLHLAVICIGNEITLEFGHDTSRFADADVEYVGELLETLLANALERPDRATKPRDLLTFEARQTLRNQASGSAQPIPDESLGRLFEAQAATTPDRVAVVDARASFSYRELDESANRVARALASMGAGPDVLIGVVADRSIEAISALLGILKSGAAYVPLDPAQSIERLSTLVAGAGIRLLVVQADLAPAAQVAGIPVLLLPPPADAAGGPVALGTPSPQNLAYGIYTSGSTGQPKAVAIAQGSAVNLLFALDRWIYVELGRPLRVALNAPLTFDASVKQWLQLLRGHTLCFVPEEVRFDPAAMIDWLTRERIAVFDCTPAQLRPLLASGFGEAVVPDLQAVLVGGEAIDDAMWDALSAIDRIRFYNVYGPTECTVDATVCRIGRDSDRPNVGRPLENVSTYVLDHRAELVPAGIAGELFIAGAGVARGYVDAPALTAERFLPDPFSEKPGGRMYRTGDSARWCGDRQIELMGRLDRQLKVRGYRIEPGEIEVALASHPAIQATAVTSEFEEGVGARLVAYVVAANGSVPEESDLRSWLRRALPEFMIPDRLALIDRVPLTRNGKVDYPALRRHARPLRRVSTGVAARNDLERTIAAVWRQVLQVESVGVDDNFFDLGGHSLLLTKLYAQLRSTLGREFPMMDLFRHPTVGSFAAFLTNGLAAPSLSRDALLARAARQGEAFRQYPKSREDRTG